MLIAQTSPVEREKFEISYKLHISRYIMLPYNVQVTRSESKDRAIAMKLGMPHEKCKPDIELCLEV